MVAYFIYDEGFTYICDQAGKRLPIDHSLDNLEDMLHPLEFFRVNRKLLVVLSSINQIHTYFNSRLLLKLNPDKGPFGLSNVIPLRGYYVILDSWAFSMPCPTPM